MSPLSVLQDITQSHMKQEDSVYTTMLLLRLGTSNRITGSRKSLFLIGMYIMETGHRRPSLMTRMLSTVQSTASITALFTLEILWQPHTQLSEKVWAVEEQSISHGTRAGWAIQSTYMRSTKSSCRSSMNSRQTLFWSAQDLTLPKAIILGRCL